MNFDDKILFLLTKKNINKVFFYFWIIFKKKKFFFFEIFLKNYFAFKIKKKIFLEIKKNNLNLKKNFNFNWLILILKKNFLKNKISLFSIDEFLSIIISSFLSKDLNLFLNWIKIILEKLDLKFHKNFFNYLFFTFKVLNYSYIKILNCLGLRFIIRGKIGIGGGVKTRNILFKVGQNSINNKSLKLDFQKIQIKTKSGIIGLKIFLFY